MLMGLGLVIYGIATIASYLGFRTAAAETTAVITEIDSVGHGEDTIYTVYVKFIVDDIEYKGELDGWRRGMIEGHVVKVYYDLDNPQNFRLGSGWFNGCIALLFGAFVFLSRLMPLLRQLKYKFHRRRLFSGGY